MILAVSLALATPGGELELLAEEMFVGTVAFGVPAAAVAGDFEGGAGLFYGGAVGLGVGTAGAIAINRWKKPDVGQAMALTTWQTTLAGNGIGWGFALGLDREAGWIGLGGLGAGTAVGLWAMDRHPAAGDVATVRAGLLWGALAGLSVRAIDPRDRFWDVGTFVVGADIGLVAGLIVAVQPGAPSREQVARVQVAGLGGGAAGLAVGLGLQGYGAGNERTVFGAAALGAGLGVGLGIANLRPLRGPGNIAVLPTDGGAKVTWSGRL